jgi:hypothetical protein
MFNLYQGIVLNPFENSPLVRALMYISFNSIKVIVTDAFFLKLCIWNNVYFMKTAAIFPVFSSDSSTRTLQLVKHIRYVAIAAFLFLVTATTVEAQDYREYRGHPEEINGHSGYTRNILKTGDYLQTNEYITSRNRNFYLIMQFDGNLCIYRGSDPAHNNGYVWGTQKTDAGKAFFAVMQVDGNFCVYKGTSMSDNRGLVWCAMCNRPGGSYFAMLQDNGVLTVNTGDSPRDSHEVIWSAP